jgi:hypothetical protein
MPDGSPMGVMKTPVFDAIQLCLSADATDEEIICAAVQVCAVIYLLY